MSPASGALLHLRASQAFEELRVKVGFETQALLRARTLL